MAEDPNEDPIINNDEREPGPDPGDPQGEGTSDDPSYSPGDPGYDDRPDKDTIDETGSDSGSAGGSTTKSGSSSTSSTKSGSSSGGDGSDPFTSYGSPKTSAASGASAAASRYAADKQAKTAAAALAWEKDKFGKTFPLQESEATGYYKGEPTTAWQKTTAELTGEFQGKPTVAYQKMIADLTGEFQGKPTLEKINMYWGNYLKQSSLSGYMYDQDGKLMVDANGQPMHTEESRHNVAVETETGRHNVVTEGQEQQKIGISEGELTGFYKGQLTEGARHNRRVEGFQEGELTGVYNGQLTEAARAEREKERQSLAALTGYINGQLTDDALKWRTQVASDYAKTAASLISNPNNFFEAAEYMRGGEKIPGMPSFLRQLGNIGKGEYGNVQGGPGFAAQGADIPQNYSMEDIINGMNSGATSGAENNSLLGYYTNPGQGEPTFGIEPWLTPQQPRGWEQAYQQAKSTMDQAQQGMGPGNQVPINPNTGQPYSAAAMQAMQAAGLTPEEWIALPKDERITYKLPYQPVPAPTAATQRGASGGFGGTPNSTLDQLYGPISDYAKSYYDPNTMDWDSFQFAAASSRPGLQRKPGETEQDWSWRVSQAIGNDRAPVSAATASTAPTATTGGVPINPNTGQPYSAAALQAMKAQGLTPQQWAALPKGQRIEDKTQYQTATQIFAPEVTPHNTTVINPNTGEAYSDMTMQTMAAYGYNPTTWGALPKDQRERMKQEFTTRYAATHPASNPINPNLGQPYSINTMDVMTAYGYNPTTWAALPKERREQLKQQFLSGAPGIGAPPAGGTPAPGGGGGGGGFPGGGGGETSPNPPPAQYDPVTGQLLGNSWTPLPTSNGGAPIFKNINVGASTPWDQYLFGGPSGKVNPGQWTAGYNRQTDPFQFTTAPGSDVSAQEAKALGWIDPRGTQPGRWQNPRGPMNNGDNYERALQEYRVLMTQGALPNVDLESNLGKAAFDNWYAQRLGASGNAAVDAFSTALSSNNSTYTNPAASQNSPNSPFGQWLSANFGGQTAAQSTGSAGQASSNPIVAQADAMLPYFQDILKRGPQKLGAGAMESMTPTELGLFGSALKRSGVNPDDWKQVYERTRVKNTYDPTKA